MFLPRVKHKPFLAQISTFDTGFSIFIKIGHFSSFFVHFRPTFVPPNLRFVPPKSGFVPPSFGLCTTLFRALRPTQHQKWNSCIILPKQA